MKNVSRRGFIKASAGLAAVASMAEGADSAAAEPPEAEQLLAGVAARDITPPPGLPMWGYTDREGPATGTLDPLFAKAVVFRAGASSAAIVTLDLGRPLLPAIVERIRARAREVGVQDTAFVATHTHHGPALESINQAHIAAIEQGVSEAIAKAAGSLEPVRMSLGRTQADVAHNRRIITPDGRCLMMWRNETKRPTEPIDPEMTVIRLDKTDNTPLATLVSFACHPVVMGPSNLQYSGDFCGEMARIVKNETGAECLFLQGACGDINPYLDKTPLSEGGVAAMRDVGRECADAVLRSLGQAKPLANGSPSVSYSEQPVTVGIRFDLSNDDQVAVLRGVYGNIFDFFMRRMTPDLAVPLGVMTLNNALAFAFMPGEIFVQFQLVLKQMSPVPNTLLCAYANDFHAYFPTIRDAAAGGYGGLVASYVGVGAGDRLVMEACAEIGRQTGALKDFYAPEDFVLADAKNV